MDFGKMALPNLVGETSRGSNFNAAWGYRVFFLYSTNQSGVYFGNRSFRVVPAFRGLKHCTEFVNWEDPRFTTSLITETKKRLLYFQGFGKADHEVTVGLLKKKYPDYTITWSDDGY